MNGSLEITIAIAVATVALAGLILPQNASLHRELTACVDRLEADMGVIRAKLRDLPGRVARIKSVLVGPQPVELPPTSGPSDRQEAT